VISSRASLSTLNEWISWTLTSLNVSLTSSPLLSPRLTAFAKSPICPPTTSALSSSTSLLVANVLSFSLSILTSLSNAANLLSNFSPSLSPTLPTTFFNASFLPLSRPTRFVTGLTDEARRKSRMENVLM